MKSRGPLDSPGRFLDWLPRLGFWRGVLAVTAVSVGLSLVMTGVHLRFMVPEPVPYERWVYTAIIIPSIVAPAVTAAVLSLAFRLIDTQAALAAAANTDHLTGIGNRRAFIDLTERELARSERHGSDFGLLIIDIDHFKALNDRHGHLAGDDALARIAVACLRVLRRSDVFCRWGGEEFIALLPETNLAGTLDVAEKLRLAVAGVDLPSGHTLTASIGVTSSTSGAGRLDDLIREADRQLYLAKATGRNTVMPKRTALPAA